MILVLASNLAARKLARRSRRQRRRFPGGPRPFWPQRLFWVLAGLAVWLFASAATPNLLEFANAAARDRLEPQPSAAVAPLGQGEARFGENLEALHQAIKEASVFKAPEIFQRSVVRGGGLPDTDKVVALTFDDGPHPRGSVQILDILKEHDVKATFFVIGRHLQAFPEVARRMAAEGHAIGNHTWNHRMARANWNAAAVEIDNTANLIQEVMQVSSFLYRPPGGVLDNGIDNYAYGRDYTTIMWTADTQDWRNPSAQLIVDRAINGTHSGGIVLMHDGGHYRANTIQALPGMIREFKARGYRFVTIPELLEMKAAALEASTEASNDAPNAPKDPLKG